VAGEAVFVVYRMGPGSPDFVKHADVPANRTSFVDQGLAPGTRYTYLVRAWHPDRGVSRRSNEASATTPLAQ
jgi:chitodextrinase